jgi:copper chaperone CopZ
MNTLKFKLQGMHCESCVKISKMNLSDINGVKEVELDLASGEGKLTSDREIALSEVEAAMKDTEYKVIKSE